MFSYTFDIWQRFHPSCWARACARARDPIVQQTCYTPAHHHPLSLYVCVQRGVLSHYLAAE